MPTQEELDYRDSKTQRLRDVLKDGKWHTGLELDKRVGWRFGAALERIRKGLDGNPPWNVTTERVTADGSVFRYRYEGLATAPPPKRTSWRERAMRAEKKLRELGAA